MRQILRNKKITYTALVLVLLVAFGVAAYFTYDRRAGQTDEAKQQASSKSQESERVLVPEKTTEPEHIKNKQACDLFSVEIAREVLGEGAKQADPIVSTFELGGMVSGCAYELAGDRIEVKVHLYEDTGVAKENFDEIKKKYNTPHIKRIDNVIIISTATQNEQDNQDGAKKVLDAITKGLRS